MSIGSSPFQGGGSASIADATESTAGKIRIATTSESTTGTNDVTAMTPAKVKARIDAALVGGIDYKGTFNATTGLTNSGGNLNNAEQGDLYVIDTAGTIYGATWAVGDHLLINADMGGSISNSKIDKVDNTDLVTSVNGQTGAVNIYADDSTLNIAGTGLSISGSGATSTLNADSASDSAAGIIEIATNAEATAGSATDKALVPSNLSSVGTSQLNNDAGFITSAGVGNQITTVEQKAADFTAVSNAIYFIASSLTVTLPSSSLSDGDLLGFTTRGTSTPTLTLSGALHTIGNVQTSSTTVETNKRGLVWFSYDSGTSRWAQLNESTKLSSSTTAGIIEIATNAEATAGSATDKALVPSNLSSVGTSQLNNDAGFITSVASASDTTAGIIEIATNAEATAGSATDKALVPSNLSSVGTSQLNNDAGFITSVASASESTAGIIEIATNAEATAGSATDKALVPSNVASLSIANTQVAGLGTASTAASTDFQPVDAGLTSISGLTTAADKMIYTTGSDTYAVTSLTAAGRALLDDADAAAQRTTLGLAAVAASGAYSDLSGTPTVPTALNTLTDVSISSVSNGQVISYNSTSGEWENSTPTSGGATDLNGLSDVTITGAAAGNLLERNGAGQFINVVKSTIDVGDFNDDNTYQPKDAGLTSISGLTTAADKMIYTTGSDTYAVTSLTAAGRALLDDADAAAQRTTLGLGTAATSASTDFQAVDAGLTSISGLTTAADKMIYTTGSDTYAVTDLTSAGRALLDDADAAAQRTTLGLVIGTDVLSDVVQDTTPQLGGNLDLNGQDIVTTSNANLELAPDGTGVVSIKGNTTGGNNQGALKLWCENNSHGIALKSPAHSAGASYNLILPTSVGTSGQVLKTDGGDSSTPKNVQLSWVDQSGGGSVPGVTSASPATDYDITTHAGIEEVYLLTPSANIAVNIPSASDATSGFKYQIKNLSGSYNLTVTPASGSIDTSGTYVISNQYESVTLVSDGSNYFII